VLTDHYDSCKGLRRTTNTLDDLKDDIQTGISHLRIAGYKGYNENGRLQFALTNTLDANGNRLKIYLKQGIPTDLLQNIKVKTDTVTGMSVSKREDINYQIGISDSLNINVVGTQLFGSGIKNDMGDFIISFNKFIDSLSRTGGNSYVNGQPMEVNASSPLDLSNNNQFDIMVKGNARFTQQLPYLNPGGYTYDGTAGKPWMKW
jgi:hypothetical protein